MKLIQRDAIDTYTCCQEVLCHWVFHFSSNKSLYVAGMIKIPIFGSIQLNFDQVHSLHLHQAFKLPKNLHGNVERKSISHFTKRIIAKCLVQLSESSVIC